MNCKDVRDNVVFFLDGELGEKDAREVETHLASCPPCSEEADGLKASFSLFQGLPRLESETWMQPAVWARIKDEQGKQGLFWFLKPHVLIPVGAAVGLALLVFLTPLQQLVLPTPEDDGSLSADFLVNYQIIKDLDTLQDLDLIEKLPESSQGVKVVGRA